MDTKAKIEALITKKRQELVSLELERAEAKGYMAALKDFRKDIEEVFLSKPSTLKSGSRAYQAFQAIKQAGRPLHIKEIIELLDLPDTKEEYINLMSALNEHSKKNRYFCRTAMATFGLLGVDK